MTERDVFLAALAIDDPEARAGYLAGACGGDGPLRGRIESLLRSHSTAGSFLGEPAGAETTGAPPRSPAAEDEPFAFLAPGRRPDSLGRLGQYEVLELLGRGGFGIVFRAFDDVLQRVVALKVMAPQLAVTSPARQRFLREARSAAKVRHENVVQVYEIGEQPLPYLAMEFVPGESLQQRLQRVGPLPAAEVARIGQQVAEGLAAAHRCGLIHRDIKPANVLLEAGSRQRARITDFGLARAADDASLTQSGVLAGTPLYMAPEQASGEPLDHRADLFSLGSLLYAITAGRPPFRAGGVPAVLKRVAEDAPRPLAEVIPETPAWLCDIIRKLQAKRREDRYQTADEVAEELARCLASPPPEPPPRRRGRGRVLVAAVAVLAVAGVIAGARLIHPPRDAGAGRVGQPPREKLPPASDRPIAEELLAVGGYTLHVRTDGGTKEVVLPPQLPPGEFWVEGAIQMGGTSDDALLAKLPRLKYLSGVVAWGDGITDAGAAALAGMPSLTSVGLGRTRISDAGVKRLAAMPRLGFLSLTGTPVTDAALAHLKGAQRLEYLYLEETRVTDAGLAHLAGLKTLQAVSVERTKVTAAGVKMLAAALPKCRVTWDGGTESAGR